MKPHRAQLSVIAVVAAVIVLPGAVALAGQSPTAAGATSAGATSAGAQSAGSANAANAGSANAGSVGAAAPAGLLWEGDASRGTKVFEALEQAPGKITVADDPQGRYGRSFRFETWDNANGSKERCESRGIRTADGKVLRLDSSAVNKTFYVGWKSLLDPMPVASGRWVSFWQLHWSGAGPGGGPMTIRTLGDGKIHLQYVAPNGSVDRNIWSAPLQKGKWVDFVVAFKLARDGSGYVEFWYNGVQQKLANGSTRWTGPLFKGTHVNLKWGVYRSGPNSGHAVQYVNDPELGTTYDAVKP
jgi:Polysaccharide lyase